MAWRVRVWRVVLFVVGGAATWAALSPEFRGWQLVPHTFLYGHGVSYHSVLWFERNMGSGLHFFGALALMLLLPAARVLPGGSARSRRWFAAALLACAGVAVEAWQWGFTGRGFGLDDLGFQALGMAVAVLIWRASDRPGAPSDPGAVVAPSAADADAERP